MRFSSGQAETETFGNDDAGTHIRVLISTRTHAQCTWMVIWCVFRHVSLDRDYFLYDNKTLISMETVFFLKCCFKTKTYQCERSLKAFSHLDTLKYLSLHMDWFWDCLGVGFIITGLLSQSRIPSEPWICKMVCTSYQRSHFTNHTELGYQMGLNLEKNAREWKQPSKGTRNQFSGLLLRPITPFKVHWSVKTTEIQVSVSEWLNKWEEEKAMNEIARVNKQAWRQNTPLMPHTLMLWIQ